MYSIFKMSRSYHVFNGTGFCFLDINECEDTPCQNNGTCVNTDGGYNCNCTRTGYTGTVCQTGNIVCYLHNAQIVGFGCGLEI